MSPTENGGVVKLKIEHDVSDDTVKLITDLTKALNDLNQTLKKTTDNNDNHQENNMADLSQLKSEIQGSRFRHRRRRPSDRRARREDPAGRQLAG